MLKWLIVPSLLLVPTSAMADVEVTYKYWRYTYEGSFNRDKPVTVVIWRARNSGSKSKYASFEFFKKEGSRQQRAGTHPFIAHALCEQVGDDICPPHTLIALGAGRNVHNITPGAEVIGISVFKGRSGTIYLDE